MIEVHQFDRLRATAQRKRWLVGLMLDSRGRQLRAALVGAEERGLSSRVEVFADWRLKLPAVMTGEFSRLRRGHAKSPVSAALFAAQLAECQATLLEQLSAEIAPVWDRVLAVAVEDPGLWRRWSGVTGYVSLCDSARLAELSGRNVIDSFAARDIAQGGSGRPLLPIPHWILLHHPQKTRVLVHLGRAIGLTWLPASRDAAGAMRVAYFRLTLPTGFEPGGAARAIVDCLSSQFPRTPRPDEFILSGSRSWTAAVTKELASRMSAVQRFDPALLGIGSGALCPAAVALLGLLHLDGVPANASGITGVRVPRVLGRLTPGSPQNWHRLVRELADAKPSVIPLRSAV